MFNNLVFFKDTFIHKVIAFVLNIKYVFIDEIKYLNDKIIYIDDIYEKDFNKLNLKRNIDYILFDDICNFLDKLYNVNTARKNINEINEIGLEKLSISEMLIKVLFSKPKDINCCSILNEAKIHSDGNLWPCCPNWVAKPFGNILTDNDVYNNYQARIIKLSALNKTYCFCNLHLCKYNGSLYLDRIDENNINFNIKNIPEQLSISIDERCHLRCNSCRKSFYIPSKDKQEKSKKY